MFGRKIFFFGLLFVFTTSFFWDDEEKQVKQHYLKAETAMSGEKYDEAIKAYEDLLDKVDALSWQKIHMDWRTYVDTILRLTTAYEAVKNYEDATSLLNKLLSKKPPEEFLGQIKLVKARISKGQSSKEQYKEMKSVLSSYPQEFWKKEDLSFFRALEFTLNSQYDELVHKAKRQQLAGCYEKAISIYEEILSAIENGFFPKIKSDSFLAKKIRFHLAECHFAAHHFEQALNLCDKTNHENQIDKEMIYLSALCFKEKQEYEKALELFQRYFSSGSRQDLEHYDHALFEIGHFYFRKNQFAKAKRYFELLQNFKEKRKKPSLLASIYLAKICMNENRLEEVENLLADLSTEFSSNDPLRYECFFLRGQAHYFLGHTHVAKELFEKSIPQNKIYAELKRSCSYYLGLTYLKLIESPLENYKAKYMYCEKGEEIFLALKEGKTWEEATLALAKLYLLKTKLFAEPGLDKVHTLLSEKFDKFSLPSRLESLLLRALASSSFLEKETFYKVACDPLYNGLPKYNEALTLRGLNFFQEGLRDKTKNSHFFEEASLSFEKAFNLLGQKDSFYAARLLKLEATSHFYCNSPDSSLALLEKLLTQFSEPMEEREETLYLRGLIASKLSDPSYHRLAEHSFLKIISDTSSGKYGDRAVHMLGALYYKEKNYEKAKEAFGKFGTQFAHSELAPEGLFWAAECSDKLGQDSASYRIQLYENHPHSPRAPEAFFRRFPYSNYLEKEETSFKHLKEFPGLYPQSSLLVCVYCLLGMNENSFDTASAFFDESLHAFQTLVEDGKTVNASLVYFYYLSLLERAQLYLTHEKNLEEAITILHSINHDFLIDFHPYASLLREKSLYPSIFEESEFTLARAYLKLGFDAKAIECFASMLKHYDEAKISKGTFLSLLWKEEGKLAIKARDFDTAIKCFEIASECGVGYLSDDQILSVWILQSSCHKEKKEYDLAMRLLSRVINADMVSKLRLEAMSLRAEIYELQNRPELAIRQLEAAAKKGSLEAQLKLKEKYGL